MSDTDTMAAADEPRKRGRRKGEHTGPMGPRRSPRFRPGDAIKAASDAGFAKVKMTIDNDGNVTLEMGQAGDSPDGAKREQNQWDDVLKPGYKPVP